MSTKPNSKTSARRSSAPAENITLASVASALERRCDLAATRLRDLRSAVKRVAILLGQEPGAIRLDLAAIGSRLAAVNPMVVGIKVKRFATIRSDFLAAVKASGLASVAGTEKAPKSGGWMELFRHLSGRRAHIGLSRLVLFGVER
jgi:hypothetical protein